MNTSVSKNVVSSESNSVSNESNIRFFCAKKISVLDEVQVSRTLRSSLHNKSKGETVVP